MERKESIPWQKGTKRLTALLLVLALSLSLLPTAGLAAEGKSSASAAAAETVSQNSGTISTYAASGSTTVPYTGIQYSYAAGVKKGAIRYVSQNPKGEHYQDSYWGQRCWQQPVSLQERQRIHDALLPGHRDAAQGYYRKAQ